MLGKLSVGLHESFGQDNTKKRKPSTSGESLCESLVPPPSETKKFDNICLSQHLGNGTRRNRRTKKSRENERMRKFLL
jgi:hypothetical protein